MPSSRILIVEDDKSLADVIVYQLAQANFEATIATDGNEGLRQARLIKPDLVILDLMLPLIDGIEICKRLRADPATRDLLILMMTAKSEETDQIVGFSVGADDYVTKPFSVKVLVERVKALLRRRDTAAEPGDVVSCYGVTVDRVRHRAVAGDVTLDLTKSEFRLLETLVRQPGRAFTRNDLIEAALGDAYVLERTIDVHVRALRKKLGPEHSGLIETVRGIGYRFRSLTGEDNGSAPE
jgi:two-component system phosphate regulon response regulator PhoB